LARDELSILSGDKNLPRQTFFRKGLDGAAGGAVVCRKDRIKI